MSRLIELRELLSKATARPWAAFDEANTLAIMKGNRPRSHSTARNRKWQEIIAWTGFDAADVPMSYRRANLHLIVAAINALPELLDEIETCREALEKIAEYDGVWPSWEQADIAKDALATLSGGKK